jgi:DNA-binding CsgD family transcriptional regulator
VRVAARRKGFLPHNQSQEYSGWDKYESGKFPAGGDGTSHHSLPGIMFVGDSIPVGYVGLLVDLPCGIEKGGGSHNGLILCKYGQFGKNGKFSPSFAAFRVGLDPLLNKVIIQSLNFGIIKIMESTNEELRELTLLEKIENDPNVNQSTLATQLGVAVGTVNWHLKRLIAKGYVKVKRAERKKLRYIITPDGIALRARLAVDYVERSFSLYRNTRQRVRE